MLSVLNSGLSISNLSHQKPRDSLVSYTDSSIGIHLVLPLQLSTNPLFGHTWNTPAQSGIHT